MKATIKNNSKAVRVLNVKEGEFVKQVNIAPGKSATADFVETKPFSASLKAGALSKVSAAKPE